MDTEQEILELKEKVKSLEKLVGAITRGLETKLNWDEFQVSFNRYRRSGISMDKPTYGRTD